MENRLRILCYGDSNTYGYVPAGNGRRYAEGIRWPSALAAQLGEEYTVIEEGLSGRTADANTDEEVWKDGRAYLCAALSTHRPLDLIIFMLGTNDCKISFHRQAEDIADTMDSILEKTLAFLKQKQGYAPEILLIAPPCLSLDVIYGVFGDDFDERSIQVSIQLKETYRKVSEKYGTLFLDASQYVHVSPKDGLHLEAREHQLLAGAVLQCVKNWNEEYGREKISHHENVLSAQ